MSHDLEMVNENGKVFELDKPLPEEECGGTYPLGGSTTTKINITYNYSWYYYQFLDKENGIKWLCGKKGKDCVKRLEEAIKPFEKSSPCKDYWCNKPGNCVRPLKILLNWAKLFPEGTFGDV